MDSSTNTEAGRVLATSLTPYVDSSGPSFLLKRYNLELATTLNQLRVKGASVEERRAVVKEISDNVLIYCLGDLIGN